MFRLVILLLASACLCSHVHREYYLINERKTWVGAQDYCRKNYTDLATFGSHDDIKLLANITAASEVTTEIWMGLKKTGVASWLWSVGEAQTSHGLAEYTNWASLPNSSHHCGGMRGDGKWLSALCETTLPFVCQAALTGLIVAPCGRWVKNTLYNCSSSSTSGCFLPSSLMYAIDARHRYQNTNTGLIFTVHFAIFTVKGSSGMYAVLHKKSWRKAQEYCRLNNTDLASVRSQTENQAVQQIVHENEPSLSLIWIGLFRDEWKWSDQSNSSFRYWANSQPNNDGVCSLVKTSTREWYDRGCTFARPFYCYYERRKEKVMRQIVRLKIQIQLNSLNNLDDSTVSEAILNQIQKTFERAKLQWRVQPDGKVFHKKKQIHEAC